MGICLLEPAYDFLNLIGVDRYQQQPVFTAGETPFTPHFGYAVMNGFEAAEAIRALDRVDAKIVPIIALSASNDPEDIGKALEAGMDTHILKPLDPKALAKMLCLDLPSGK